MNRKLQIDSHHLWLATLVYLALPIAIFAAGWLQLPFAALVLASMAIGICTRGTHNQENPTAIPLRSILLLALGCVLLCLFAGVGGFSYQDGDYFKHNAVAADLFRREWPVAYNIEHNGARHTATLAYYSAYYLPPACLGKIGGWQFLRIAMVLWTSCGLFIVCLWCLKYSRGALCAPLVFLAFGGLDWIGMLLGLKVYHWMPELWIEHRQMEWWTGFSFGNYPGHSGQFFWAPQHALPGWLIAAAVFDRIRTGTLGGCLFVAALAPLWSPLIAVGLLPIGLAGLLVTRGKGTFSRSNWAAIPLLVTSGFFFAARGMPELPFPPIPIGWNDLVPAKLLATFALEVLPWALLLLLPKQPKFDRVIPLSCILFLAILPLWKVGAFNDLMMKASLPAFSVLSFLLLQKFDKASNRWKKVAMVTLLAGSCGLAFDITRHIEFSGSKARQIEFSSPAKVPTLPATPDLVGLLNQYLGSPHTIFFQNLAKPLPSVADSVPYNQEAPPPGAIESQNRLQVELRHRFQNGERSMDFLREYSTLCYYQGDLWESLLALETMVKLDPNDPNARINLATLLSTSGIQAYRDRALSELDSARPLVRDPAGFDRATRDLRQSLKSNP